MMSARVLVASASGRRPRLARLAALLLDKAWLPELTKLNSV